MSNSTQLKQAISQHVQNFSSQPLRQAALSLFATLGYESDRTVETPSVAEFRAQFDSESKLKHPAALIASWKSAELLFQLTDEELSRSTALFKDEAVKTSLLQSYVFIAIELDDGDYARGKLAGIARQINRIFPMPVMVLFKIGGRLSIAVINRRLNKRDDNKDVLGKVTLIQNIVIGNPHPGHLDILASFSLAELTEGRRVIKNFDQLHAAWEEVFNVELLNKRFYRELANWYFWALPQVDFPADIEKDDEKRRATGLIRLLTRLIFCWFLKEKNLVPDKLFAEDELKKILKDLSPDASTYNEAILQNLFFATLNQRMGKDKNGLPYRAFAKDEGFPKNRATYGVDTLYRYEDHFRDPATALDQFADVPFLNGGLFECLDRTEEVTGKKRYLDGFSRTKSKRPTLPNHLFFSAEHEADLSEAYGDKKRKKEKVRGLLHILNAYKFTIVENTPVDQEIALDPELLGKVFENLLASYNEETKTTARKQTGSFYTPRPIVDYMVDESLKAHLTGALVKAGMSEQDAKTGLDILFAYTERAHPFNEREVATLLDAIHTCKILDPACGSGAFPMGMLHKLVYIIHKLDPDNARWKQLQIDAAAKIPDVSARDAAITAIERDFADNEDDYGRKLYLIENCLYGVDIQPIAIQISKLRFFISLVCNQRTNRNKKDNHGIRPLPNLETKFVAADTLIGLPEIDQLALLPGRVDEIEGEIEELYHRHFAVQRRDQKLALQKKLKGLREELGKVLAESLGSSKKAQYIADWNPFDPQEVAGFFDPLWMFGRSLTDGFDIVIGNPPYLRIQGIQQANPVVADYYKKHYESATGSFDLYVIFIERGLQLIRDGGVLNYINPDKWVNAAFGKGIRKLVAAQKLLHRLISFGAHQVFSACTYSSLLWMRKTPTEFIEYTRIAPDESKSVLLDDELEKLDSTAFASIPYASISEEPWILAAPDSAKAMEALLSTSGQLHQKVKIFVGLQTSKDSVYFLHDAVNRGGVWEATSKELGERIEIEDGLVRPLLMGDQVHRYEPIGTTNLVVFPYDDGVESTPVLLSAHAIQQCFPKGWAYLQRCEEVLRAREHGRFNVTQWYQFGRKQGISEGGKAKLLAPDISLGGNFSIDKNGSYYTTTTLYGYIKNERTWESYEFLLAILNSKVLWFYLKNTGSVLANGYYRYKPTYLQNFPVPEVSQAHEATIAKIVSCLLAQKASQPADMGVGEFLDDLIDACVMELYFRDHMAERDLLFLDDLAPHLAAYNSDATEPQQRVFIEQFHRTLNAPESTIRNRLLRISADSPDLLAVIQREGKV
ncbi:Eco57I restriction-modification methylase domain-containing protein [Pseudomonas aeruginosa]|uniref:Eco57I restriction-modification methylase domain-containing protein n=1 Tax=Pseudomonas aeruginosa TaxID=287 RepID=UPI003A806AC2